MPRKIQVKLFDAIMLLFTDLNLWWQAATELGFAYPKFDMFLAEHPANRFGKAPTRMQCYIAHCDIFNAWNRATLAAHRAETRWFWLLERKELQNTYEEPTTQQVRPRRDHPKATLPEGA